MKKVRDWDIKIKVNVATCKQVFTLVCSVHTRMQEITIRVCKLMGLDRFDTKMEMYCHHYLPMKPISTLLQNGVTTGDVIVAQILNTKKKETSKSLPATKRGNSTLRKKETINYGLTLVCSCIQPKCINYGIEQLVPMGLGQFRIYDVVSTRKCNVCPYRDQKKNPSMVSKQIRLTHCYWKISGTHNSSDFPTQLDTGFKKAGKEDDIYKALSKHRWNQDILLTVKGL